MDQIPIRLDMPADVREGLPVTRQAQSGVEPPDLVERVKELAGRVRRPAVVVVQRHAPEQVVAGDEQPPVGLEETDVRGGVARGLVDLPGPEVAVDRHALDQVVVGLDERRDPEALPLALLGVATQRLLGHAGLARHLQAPGERGLGVLRRLGHVLVVRMHPQLAAGALEDGRGLAVVIGMGVRARQQAHVLELQVDLVQRALEVREEPGSCIPVSTSTIPSPEAIAHALQCGTPGQGSGSRSRHTPGITRSPRPTSRLRTASAIGAAR